MKRLAWLLPLWTVLVAPLAAWAVDESDLLPVEQAFALTATAKNTGRIEFTWRITDGYYLYRHRIQVTPVGGNFQADPLQLPEGQHKNDEFFGDVQTYRQQVTAVLTGTAASGTETVEFDVGYQGCADLGVCYPPHRQRIAVALPAADTATSSSNRFSAPADTPSLLGIPAASTSLLSNTGNASVAATDSLPLPAQQAFGFEAIAASATELLLRFTPAPGYYLYRDRSSFELVDADGVTLGAPRWPEGQLHEDPHFGQVTVYFDQIEVPMALYRHNAAPHTINLKATFQGCENDGICYPPMTRIVAVALPAATGAELAAVPLSQQQAAPSSQSAASTSNRLTIAGVLLALLFALGGGLILNLMPCVLPVLSLKALSLTGSGESPAVARRHALWYAAGVLATFAAVGSLALALRATGQSLGWGFQLQQPVMVALLVYVMLAIGLALSGVYQFGAGIAGIGQSLTQRTGPAGDFFTGALAVIVASPCTAPFMGSALAFAFAASGAVALAVFLALGLGLALPFLLIGFVPALAIRLPKPGAWMETFKQALAFPMYLTAAWLVWVLARQRGADAVGLVLLGAIVLSFGLWWRERLRGRMLGGTLALLVVAGSVVPLLAIHVLPVENASAHPDGAPSFSTATLNELRSGDRPVFVNLTADWCVTCKVNERAVFSSERFRELLTSYRVAYVIGDWTNINPEITAFLDAHQAVGVPFYVVYPGHGREGEVLPALLTVDTVEQALKRAVGTH